MQFQVPQFIETEDKIVGPLTLRQFAYVAAGALVSAMLYFTVQTWLWILGSLIIFAVAGGLAFVKIEGQPFARVVLSAFNFYWKPQTYVWQPEHPAVAKAPTRADEENQSALEEILRSAASKVKRESPRVPPAANRGLAAPLPSEIARKAQPITREAASAGASLHKMWQSVQTGAPFGGKNSDKQFFERKMRERYEIFQRTAGDRRAAKRVDYR